MKSDPPVHSAADPRTRWDHTKALMPAGGNKKHNSNRRGFSGFQVVVLILCASLAQRLLTKPDLGMDLMAANRIANDNPPGVVASSSSSPGEQQQRYNALAIPLGGTINLPSVRVEEDSNKDNVDEKRSIYGGKGDKAHLGGFTEIDMSGISPAVWKHVVANWTVQSVLDVGCGRGISTSWFYTHGLRTECVEGSHDAITQTMVPDPSILTEHDFSRGPWWPEKTFDMVWSVEFLEHVNLQFHYNYVSTFRKAAILLVSSSRWGGWHHVEVHPDAWWIRKYEMYGFKYDPELTKEIRSIASRETLSKTVFPPNGEKFDAQHVHSTIKVFVNPVVAALPEHAHLLGGFGCFERWAGGIITNRECGVANTPNQEKTAVMETRLDPAFYPLKLDANQDQAWYDIVKKNIGSEAQGKRP